MLTVCSLLAGNINQLILKVSSYAQSLKETQGIIAEFVNPKYKDASKTAFKSSTRLECMMQDYPKALPSSAAVGFTLVNQVRPCLTLWQSSAYQLFAVLRLSHHHVYVEFRRHKTQCFCWPVYLRNPCVFE